MHDFMLNQQLIKRRKELKSFSENHHRVGAFSLASIVRITILVSV